MKPAGRRRTLWLGLMAFAMMVTQMLGNSRGIRARRWLGLMAFAMMVTACSGETSPKPTATNTAGSCSLSDIAVPSCGVLWGVSTQPPNLDAVRQIEQEVGRKFDFAYRYHDLNDVVPDAAERETVASGRLLHIAIAAVDFKSKAVVKWADIANGKFDAQLSAQAKGVASLGVPVFMTFEQEANQKQKTGVRGTPTEFIAAWRHLHELYEAAGAEQAIWTWVMTGSEDNLQTAGMLWPGNDYVDWISWNVYNQSGCKSGKIDPAQFISFADKLKIFYDFIKSSGAELGIDANKPMMISETGSAKYDSQPELTAKWYEDIPKTLRKYPQIKAVGIWDSIDEKCNYQVATVPQVREGVRKAGQDSWLDDKGAVKAS